MASLGVAPLARRPGEEVRPERSLPLRPPRPETVEPDEEDALFVASMKDLGRLPDKDETEAPRRRPAARRLKASQSRDTRPEATLDLHGSTTEESLVALARFVAAAKAERLRTVLVVTGKGLRSAGGVAVLKEAVESWLRNAGTRSIDAFSEAPRALGGRGAYVLYLRRR